MRRQVAVRRQDDQAGLLLVREVELGRLLARRVVLDRALQRHVAHGFDGWVDQHGQIAVTAKPLAGRGGVQALDEPLHVEVRQGVEGHRCAEAVPDKHQSVASMQAGLDRALQAQQKLQQAAATDLVARVLALPER